LNTFRFDKRLGAVISVLWLAALACNAIPTTRVNELRTDTHTIPADSATSADVQIEMGAGELSVQGGTGNLMDATFRYNVDEWKPSVDYRENGGVGELTVSQQGERVPVGSQVVNEWVIQLSNDLPLNLTIRTGASKSDLALSALNLNQLNIETGVGVTELDLSGGWQQDVSVSIEGGVGELTVKLPSEMGVRVNMDTALVGVNADNLIKDDQGYVNQAYGTAPHTLTLDLQAGVGAVTLVAP
jgi:hypothetical protein